MNLLLHVRKDGTVDYAKLMETTGDAEWDSLALKSVLQWRFAPPLRGGVPSDLWARQLFVVRIKEPVTRTLTERLFPDRRQADSVYALLERGTASETIFTQPARGIDINVYAAATREALRRLQVNQYTSPVRVGEGFVIFKRVSGTGQPEQPDE